MKDVMNNLPAKIQELVDKFTEHYDKYKQSDYNETQTRREFIDPFFKELGWDVDNIEGNAEHYKEVIHEDRVKISGNTKSPDYSFRIGGQRMICNSKNSIITIQKRKIDKNKFTLQNSINICPDNERIKHKYYDKVPDRKSEKTLKQIVYSINSFDNFTKHKNYKLFDYKTAKDFKKYILDEKSINTAYRILSNLREFFFWLKDKDGYKKLESDDIATLQLSLRDKEKVNFVEPKEIIPLEQIEEIAINFKPIDEKEVRIQVILAFLLLANGIRIESALFTKIEDVHLEQDYVYQRDPKTGRPQKTDFLNFRPEIKEILINWINLLKSKYGFTGSDPLFPAIQITTNDSLQFEKDGFKKEFIKPNAIREELQKHFESYDFTPHIVRHSLAYFFYECDLTREQEKAFSQNMSHKSIYTTYDHYYNLSPVQKTQIIKKFNIEEMRAKNKIKDMPEYQYILSKLNDKEEVDRIFKIMTKKDEEC